jgi:hypothetical protein
VGYRKFTPFIVKTCCSLQLEIAPFVQKECEDTLDMNQAQLAHIFMYGKRVE